MARHGRPEDVFEAVSAVAHRRVGEVDHCDVIDFFEHDADVLLIVPRVDELHRVERGAADSVPVVRDLLHLDLVRVPLHQKSSSSKASRMTSRSLSTWTSRSDRPQLNVCGPSYS